jgi:hypothetical protein
MSTGKCILTAVDLINGKTSSKNNDILTRQIGDTCITFKDNQVVLLNQKISLDKITRKQVYNSKTDSYKGMSNPHFGTFDIDTYIDKDGLAKVYALGFVTLLDKKIKTYYITDYSKSLDSNILIITCINDMLIPKYHNYIFYVHNLGKFDVIFLYKTLAEFNIQKGYDYYKLQPLFRGDQILRLSISIKLPNKKTVKITFVDSLNLLNNSLANLAKDFKVNTLKSYFPYNFVNKETFNYNGVTPSITYYNGISAWEYNEGHFRMDWDLKSEVLTYLEKDLLSLLEVLDKFNKELFLEYNLQMTEGLTISRLALNLFMKNYLKDKAIPRINKFNLYNFISFAYYGGNTEVYIPYGENLFYNDVNSLYPHAALNPMPGTECNYLESFDDKGLDLNQLFGIFYAKVITNDQYLGLLPVKTERGLIFPLGTFTGVWTSEELKFAHNNGYTIIVIKGYQFNKIESPFTNYVKELYEIKANSSGSKKVVTKSLLNNLIGRFGMNIFKPVTQEVTGEKLDHILATRKVTALQPVTDNKSLITYLPTINEQICVEHGLDYEKVLSKETNYNLERNIDTFKDVSITVSAFVTSYARIFMCKIKLLIIKLGGKIYYSDTDSLVTDIPLDTLDLSHLLGKELGQFKLEYEIKEGYFLSNKTYCLTLLDGSTVIKAKGVSSDSLNVDQFKNMYYNSNQIKAKKIDSVKSYKDGSVKILEKEVLLNYNAYTKREKVYSNNLWVDTKPLSYNNIEKRITVYKP